MENVFKKISIENGSSGGVEFNIPKDSVLVQCTISMDGQQKDVTDYIIYAFSEQKHSVAPATVFDGGIFYYNYWKAGAQPGISISSLEKRLWSYKLGTGDFTVWIWHLMGVTTKFIVWLSYKLPKK